MKGLRKWIFPLLVLLVAVGLVYTLTLDTSTPTPSAQEEVEGAVSQTEQSPTGIIELSYTVGDVGLHFAIDETGAWQWQDDISFPLDDAYIAQVATQIETMTYQRAIPFTDTVLASDYGLDDPWCTIEAVEADGTITHLAIGNCGTEENNYYVIKDGDDSRALVYVIDWIDLVLIPIYDMMILPTLPELSATTVQGLVVTVGETLVAMQPVFADGDTQTWHVTGEEGTVEYADLLDVLRQLQAAKCFSYKPSDGAVSICGFEEPVASVVITYEDASAEADYLSLYFGTLAMDETYRYMRIGEESTIYLIEEALVAPFMALAA